MNIKYEKYLKMPDVPAGKILETVLKKKGMTQSELAHQSGEYATRISEYINGKRKFTIKSSYTLEHALDIDINGFFVLIQTNHEIYSYRMEKERETHPDFNKLSKALFWDTRIEKINWLRNKDWAIRRTFEYGNEQEINEIIRFYGKETVSESLSKISSDWNSQIRKHNYLKYLS